MKKVIEIENLSVFYNEICALENINLTVYEKDFLGIIGPNGGGKSTLLKVIMGLLKPSKGAVKIYGHSIDSLRVPIGYVPQFGSFDREFPISVEDAVLTGCLYGKKLFFPKFLNDDHNTVSTLLKELNIHDLRKRQIGELSGGQLQKVLIARALAAKPKILFLDEPTASVDTSAQGELMELLKELNKKITIVMVSHDIGAISSNVKTIACLNTQLYYHGNPELDNCMVEKLYGCNIDLIAHGVPHRVLGTHKEKSGKEENK
ncbi:MAG TPA: metal ABC transporter ATP-binding protein [Clostridiaceae bacterium]|nr:metal ABC transporter ATP-binding protein [Clostridiaceae bacterium]